ncbi:unnamed protein product [Parnassius apollo]|uniref:(apollo) hypothetical protein n=1 Tax=Parnassius apollo TaxID=110799 RepID=A0A8S3WG25_PARAO|nr:unnamed protein product [Parnassius apollo]
MDEKLIESVKKFPCIWNTSSDFYKCNETKDAAWDQIIVETNISDVKTAKSRRKQLRDNHRDALKRQNATRSGQARKQRKEWKYQKAMSFLLPYMSSTPTPDNINTSIDTPSAPNDINTTINIRSALDTINTSINNPSALQIQTTQDIETSAAEPTGPNENADNFETDYDF